MRALPPAGCGSLRYRRLRAARERHGPACSRGERGNAVITLHSTKRRVGIRRRAARQQGSPNPAPWFPAGT